ncbi:MAG: D-tyrosyl-tRNA(Tyr) deacylase [Gemmataceae bacterium]|nr:D-tyrosyl-tRNA(Tyr) deacylase [Gemmataceae bacterium]
MRAVIQRVLRAKVTIQGETAGETGLGLLVLLGIAADDTMEKARWMADKAAGLRIFPDALGKMNLDVCEAAGSVLVVSQFTLYGDCSKGKRPSFISAARPEVAEPLYQEFVNRLRVLGLATATGKFGADMQVELINDGPVTLIVDN